SAAQQEDVGRFFGGQGAREAEPNHTQESTATKVHSESSSALDGGRHSILRREAAHRLAGGRRSRYCSPGARTRFSHGGFMSELSRRQILVGVAAAASVA